MLARWAEQEVIVADEFRDGNSLPSGLTRWVPAGSGNRRVVEKAIAALPGGIDKIYLRGDSALYEHALMRWLDEQAVSYAISADISPQLGECITALPEDHWAARGSLESRPARDQRDPRVGRGQLPAERRHLEEGCGFAASLSRHPHPPAPG